MEKKAIVTTATKVRILKQLGDFWKMKSIMLRARQDPRLLNDPEYLRKAREYYENSSSLKEQEFWNNMNEDTKMKTVKHLVLQEINEPTQMRMIPTIDKAAVYIVLSGSVELQHGHDKDPTVLGPGAMFGAVDLFNQATQDIQNFRKLEPHEHMGDKILTAKMRKGAYVRMSMADFLDHVMVDDKEEEIRRAQAEDSRIAEIPWSEMTDDDKFYVKVFKRTRELVNKNLFAFLDSYKLVPKNARNPSFRYYHETEIFREIAIDPQEPPSVYIVIYGRLRIEVEAKRNKEKTHTIACKRKGRKPMVVKTYTMPILVLDEGSVLLLKDDSYFIGSEGEPPRVIKPTKERRLTRTELLELMEQEKKKEKVSKIKLSATDPAGLATAPSKPAVSTSSQSLKKEPLYRLKLVVEATCSYLKFPYSVFSRILDDEKLILRSMADEIKVQLTQSNNAVSDRITKLLPWLRGDMAFDVKNKKLPALDPFRPDESLAAAQMENLPLDTSLSSTMGSFPKYAVPLPTEQSLISESLPSTSLSPHRERTREKMAKTPDPNRSRLKKMIDKIKEDQPSPSIFHVTDSKSFDNFENF